MRKSLKYAPLLLLAVATIALGQSLPYTPTPAGVFSFDTTTNGWEALTSAAAYGALSYTPTPVGAYCQATAGAAWTPCTFNGGGGGGTGTVTNVGALTPLFTTSSATTTPTFALIAQTANTVFAGPASGSSAAPTFRALTAADIPSTLNPIAPQQLGTALYLVDFYSAVYPNGCNFSYGTAATPLDCAFIDAGHFNVTTGHGAMVMMTNGTYTAGQQEVLPDNSPGNSSVSVMGMGPDATIINYTGSAITTGGVINQATGSYKRYTLSGFRVSTNRLAPYCLYLGQPQQTNLSYITCADPGATAGWYIGGNQVRATHLQELQSGNYPQGHGAQITLAQSGGVPTGVTVTAAGTGYNPSSTTAQVYGYGATGAADQACTTLPTVTLTFSGAAPATVTGASVSGGSGCTANTYVQVVDVAPTQYGFVLDDFDSTAEDLEASGAQIGFYTQADAQTLIHLHPYYVPVGIKNTAGGITMLGTECDSTRQYCIDTNYHMDLHGTTQTWDGNGPYPGAAFMHYGGTAARQTSYYSVIANNNQSAGGYAGVVDSALGRLDVAPYTNMAAVATNFQDASGTGVATVNVFGTATYFPYQSSSAPTLTIGGAGSGASIQVDGARSMFGYSSSGLAIMQAGSGHGIGFTVNNSTFGTNVSAGIGTSGMPWYDVGTAVASASTIALVSPITHITGTGTISTITVPNGFSSSTGGIITVIADGTWITTTTGNIANAITAVAGQEYVLSYDGSKFYIK